MNNVFPKIVAFTVLLVGAKSQAVPVAIEQAVLRAFGKVTVEAPAHLSGTARTRWLAQQSGEADLLSPKVQPLLGKSIITFNEWETVRIIRQLKKAPIDPAQRAVRVRQAVNHLNIKAGSVLTSSEVSDLTKLLVSEKVAIDTVDDAIWQFLGLADLTRAAEGEVSIVATFTADNAATVRQFHETFPEARVIYRGANTGVGMSFRVEVPLANQADAAVLVEHLVNPQLSEIPLLDLKVEKILALPLGAADEAQKLGRQLDELVEVGSPAVPPRVKISDEFGGPSSR